MQPGASTCIIGGGCSGLTTAKALTERGLEFDWFEASDHLGGLWAAEGDGSAAYRNLHINTSRERMEFSDFPMPTSYPDFPARSHIGEYFNAYADRFGLRERVTLETRVEQVEPGDERRWAVTLAGGETRAYDAVVVANGHHWDPRWPEPAYPGEFAGEQMHAHAYLDNEQLRDRQVLVVGMGNSAMDIATDASFVAAHTLVSARRGAWVLPKYLFGKPFDQVGVSPLTGYLPWRMRQRTIEAIYRVAVGKPQDYGLPKPDHRIGDAHPTVSADFLNRVGHGEIDMRGPIESLDGERVRFADGRSEAVDLIVYCTGYKVTFPFFDPALVSAPDNDLPLYRRLFHPRARRPLLHRPAAAARRDHADRRGAGTVGRRTPAGRVRAPAARRDAPGDRARAGAHVQALRALQAPHDAGRLRGVHGPAAQGARARPGSHRGGSRRLTRLSRPRRAPAAPRRSPRRRRSGR